MGFWKCTLLLSALITLGCATGHKISQAPAERMGYMLPPARPGDEVVTDLEQRLQVNPDDAILHRELGSLFMSRTSLVEPPQRWDLARLANVHLEKAFLSLPEDPQTLIFLGLARASRSKLPEVTLVNKLTTVLDGFALMDQAVKMEPENFSLRLIRAKAEILAPAILGRSKTLQEDYTFLYNHIFKDPRLRPHLRVLGLIWLGDYHYLVGKKANAPHYWNKALALESSFTQEVADRLSGHKLGF